jgi:hypothetical protein
MMYVELYQYFVLHKRLNIPGIGTFLLERKPAVSDFPNKIILPPSMSIALHHGNATPSKNFFTWLADTLKISDRDAVIRFNDFAFELKRKLSAGDRVQWDGVGTLSSGLAGEIRFESALKNAAIEVPVKAEKVIRENAEHTVRVGEDERTSVQMLEWLNQPQVKRNYWWALALVVGLLMTMFLGWYFSEKGIKTSSTGNANALKANDSGTTYQILR